MAVDGGELKQRVHTIKRDEVDAERSKHLLESHLKRPEPCDVHPAGDEEHADIEVRAAAFHVPALQPLSAVIGPGAEQVRREQPMLGAESLKLALPVHGRSVHRAAAVVWCRASSPGASINSAAENYLSIGAHYKSSDASSVNYFDGQIDEVAVYSRALDADEIRALFDAAYSTSGSDILASNLRYTVSSGTLGAGGSTWSAGGFTTDSSMNTLTGVTGVFVPFADGEMSLALYSDSGGDPDQLVSTLGSMTYSDSGSGRFFAEIRPASPVLLEPNTTYWIVLSSTGSLAMTVADSTQQEGSCSFVPSYRQSFDAGGSWGSFSSNRPLRLHVEGVSYIFRDGFEAGLPGGWSSVAQ